VHAGPASPDPPALQPGGDAAVAAALLIANAALIASATVPGGRAALVVAAVAATLLLGVALLVLAELGASAVAPPSLAPARPRARQPRSCRQPPPPPPSPLQPWRRADQVRALLAE
jgi:hypothetical protein